MDLEDLMRALSSGKASISTRTHTPKEPGYAQARKLLDLHKEYAAPCDFAVGDLVEIKEKMSIWSVTDEPNVLICVEFLPPDKINYGFENSVKRDGTVYEAIKQDVVLAHIDGESGKLAAYLYDSRRFRKYTGAVKEDGVVQKVIGRLKT